MPIALAPPKIVKSGPLPIAGLRERFNQDAPREIPKLWSRFANKAGALAWLADGPSFGVCLDYTPDGNFDYLAGVQVRNLTEVPKEFATIELPPERYAVFTHPGHISDIHSVWMAIWSDWRPKSGEEISESPSLERYDEQFDPKTGLGGFQIWVPLK